VLGWRHGAIVPALDAFQFRNSNGRQLGLDHQEPRPANLRKRNIVILAGPGDSRLARALDVLLPDARTEHAHWGLVEGHFKKKPVWRLFCGLAERGLVRQQHRGVGYYGHHWKLPETEDAVLGSWLLTEAGLELQQLRDSRPYFCKS
jgi:hypothetical protein